MNFFEESPETLMVQPVSSIYMEKSRKYIVKHFSIWVPRKKVSKMGLEQLE